MKNSNLLKLFFVLPLTFAAVTASANFDPQYYCRATCAVIDRQEQAVHVLDSVKGYSELNTDEAFDDLAQNCKNLAAIRGFSVNSTTLINGIAKVSAAYKAEQSSSGYNREGSERLKGYQFKNWRLVPNEKKSSEQAFSQSSSVDQKFDYEVNFADESSCREFKQNPNGQQKYIGSENPLG